MLPMCNTCCCSCSSWVLPTICSLMLCLTAILFFQSSMNTCSSKISSLSYPSLVKLIQDNVLNRHNSGESEEDLCEGRRVFMYDVPAQFNEDLAQECLVAGRGSCSESWGCLYCGNLENQGIGIQVPEQNSTLATNITVISNNGYHYNYSLQLRPASAWYRTHQFSLEVVFHAKMKQYACLTTEASKADAFYVPYYAGQDGAVSLRCNSMQVRDRRVNRFMGWLTTQATWQQTRGQNHFIVLGRQPLDMSRPPTENKWGLPVTTQDDLANVTFLWWEKAFARVREIGIPYPTSFHPSTDADLRLWQETVKHAKREWLVSYLGSARRKFRHQSTLLFRQELKKQCEEDTARCRFMDCTLQYTQWQIPCESEPEIIMLEFSNAVFCLQPEGDTPTRKSIFDSMIAGCIPVVFSNLTAELQYEGYLPRDATRYSVSLSKEDIAQGKLKFVQELLKIPQETVRQMQQTIREEILPHIIYTLPGSTATFHDAMDLALQQLFANISASSA